MIFKINFDVQTLKTINSNKGYIERHGSLRTDYEVQQQKVTCRRELEDYEKHEQKLLDENTKEKISKSHLATGYDKIPIWRI